MIHKATFAEHELTKIDRDDYAVLASGGPLLKVEGVRFGEDGLVVDVSWSNEDGEARKATFPAVCLCRLVPFDPTRWMH